MRSFVIYSSFFHEFFDMTVKGNISAGLDIKGPKRYSYIDVLRIASSPQLFFKSPQYLQFDKLFIGHVPI